MKFLLILILFHTGFGGFKPMVQAYDSMETCQKERQDLRKQIIAEDNVLFSLTCQVALPTNGVQI